MSAKAMCWLVLWIATVALPQSGLLGAEPLPTRAARARLRKEIGTNRRKEQKKNPVAATCLVAATGMACIKATR